MAKTWSHAEIPTYRAGSNGTITPTVPALPSCISRLRTPPASESSNDESSFGRPISDPESDTEVSLIETPNGIDSFTPGTAVAPNEASETDAAIELPHPQPHLTAQNMAKHQVAIETTVDEPPQRTSRDKQLLKARNFLAAKATITQEEYRERVVGMTRLLYEIVEENKTLREKLDKEAQYQDCTHDARLSLLRQLEGFDHEQSTGTPKDSWTGDLQTTIRNDNSGSPQRRQRETRAGTGVVHTSPAWHERAKPLYDGDGLPNYDEVAAHRSTQMGKTRDEESTGGMCKVDEGKAKKDIEGRYPTPVKCREEISKVPRRPTKPLPGKRNSLLDLPLSFDSPTVTPIRPLPAEIAAFYEPIQKLRQRKSEEVKKTRFIKNSDALEDFSDSEDGVNGNEKQLMLAETPSLQVPLSRQIDKDLGLDDDGIIMVPATIKFALPAPSTEELSKAQVYHESLNGKTIDDLFPPIRIVSNKRKASERPKVKCRIGKRARRMRACEEEESAGKRIRAMERAARADEQSLGGDSQGSFISEISRALQER